MPPLSWLVRLGVALVFATTLACRPPPQPPPYPGGEAPLVATLLANASPRVSAVAVPKAKIKMGVHRGHLAYLAQTPARFRGSVTVAGNEVISLSMHEGGYHLVNKLDSMPTGYYEGPPSACAVKALVGVDLNGERLVKLVLGGAPLIDDYRVTGQQWSRTRRRERVTLQNRKYRQELLFQPDNGRWQFSGATVWTHDGRRIWTVEHTQWHVVDGVKLPRVTRLSRPGKRRDHVVTIEVKDVNTHPTWATAAPSDSGDAAGPKPPTPTSQPSEGDESVWKDDDEADGPWENDPTRDTPSETESTSEPAVPTPTKAATTAPPATPPVRPRPATAPPVPARWKLDAGGLPVRGDLCSRNG